MKMSVAKGPLAALAVVWACGFALFIPCDAEALAADANPMQKVIDLLDILSKEVEIEGKHDAATYKKYSNWYNNETKMSTAIIQENAEKITQLQADLKEAEAFREGKSKELVDLANQHAKNSAALGDGRTKRKEERAHFEKYDTAFAQALEQLDLSIEVLNKQMPQSSTASSSASLLSVAEKLKSTLIESSDFSLSTSQHEIVDGFLRFARMSSPKDSDTVPRDDSHEESQDTSFLQLKSRFRGPYGEFQSHTGGVMGTLTDLKDKTSKEKAAALEHEAEEKKNFAAWEEGLVDLLEDEKKSMADGKSAIAQSQETSSQMESSLLEAQAIHKAEVEHLEEVESEYRIKTRAYKLRLSKRMDEGIAVHEARRVMSNEFTKRLIKRQTVGTIDFLQEERRVRHAAFHIFKQSPTPGLALLALKSTVHYKHGAKSDPFAKVKGMIKSMLDNLVQAQAEESKHAAWCDKELSATTQDKKRKDEDVQKMNDRLDALTAELTQTKADLVTVHEDFHKLNESIAEATSVRAKEHEREVTNIKESKNAIQLLKKACRVLKNYFNKEKKDVPENEKAENASGFKKRKGLASGIIGLLEIAISDFEDQLEEATQSEEISEHDFQEFQSESEVRAAVFQKDLEYKDRRRVKLEYDEVTMRNDLKSYEKESAALEDYLEKLKAQCTIQGPTYEEKKAKREAELASLKDALNYLNNQGASR
jgi:hypothetical protein|mmetsp:Transcript_95016/g.150200  ORF Transcript_95016/g.150200 Transcript_95016/m.150200 type:complete len:708 (+) Transcript_95016:61-2184(+)